MMVVSICQEMGWDYYQYLNQPRWFIGLVKDKLEVDSDNIKKSRRKMKK